MGAERSLGRQLLSGGAWALSGRILFIVLSLAVNGILARLLSPEEMGGYFLATSLVYMLAIVAEMGSGRVLVKVVASALVHNQTGRLRTAVFKTLAVSTLLTLFLTLLLVLPQARTVCLLLFDSPSMASVMAATGIFLWVFTWEHVLAELARGFGDIRLATLFDHLLGRIFLSGVLGLLWYLGSSVDIGLAMWLTAGTGLLGALAATAWAWRRMRRVEDDGTGYETREVFQVGLPIMSTNLVPAVVGVLGLWIVTAFRPESEVALFGAATRLSAFVILPRMVVAAVIPPIIARLHAAEDKAQLQLLLRSAATATFAASAAMVLGFLLLGHWFLELVFGSFYAGAYRLLAILCLGRVFSVWTGACGMSLVLTGGHKWTMGITFVAGVALVAGALLLVGPLGAEGVAWATTLAALLQDALLLFVARRKVGVWTHAGWKISFKALWRSQ